ncbi:hypothetical protein BC829DRAFT_401330 [Chytridium lagenaria]|nr:hypothetical protein BC829DRAFT_401330 [Chytridium lagenaria]
MPTFIAVPGEDRPLLLAAEPEQERVNATIRQRTAFSQDCIPTACTRFPYPSGILTLLLFGSSILVWLAFTLLVTWTSGGFVPPAPPPFVEIIDDELACSQRRIVENQTSIYNYSSSLSRINITITGTGFGAMQFQVDDTDPFIRIYNHFHASEMQEPHVGVTYIRREVEDRLFLDVNIRTPEKESNDCTVATTIVLLPRNTMGGVEVFVKSAGTVGVYTDLRDMRLGLFGIETDALFMSLANVKVGGSISVKVNSGGTVRLEVNKNSTLSKMSVTSYLGDVILDSVEVYRNLSLFSSEGSVLIKSISVDDLMKVVTSTGAMVVDGLRGKFADVSLTSFALSMSIKDFDAIASKRNAQISVTSTYGDVDINLNNYIGTFDITTSMGESTLTGTNITLTSTTASQKIGYRSETTLPDSTKTRLIQISSRNGNVNAEFV